MLGISKVIVTCNSEISACCRGHFQKCYVAKTSQITEEVQMPLDVSLQAEDGERKVQNICDDNGGIYLEAATEDFLCGQTK